MIGLIGYNLFVMGDEIVRQSKFKDGFMLNADHHFKTFK